MGKREIPQVADYQAGHRIRTWKGWADRSANLAEQVKEKSGPITTRQATAEERERYGIK